MIWNRKIECATQSEIEKLQLDKLRKTLAHVYDKVPFYRTRLDSAGLAPGNVTSLKDLERIPFTTKEDLRQNYPYDLFAVPLSKVVRIHASSGTTGKPTVVGYTRADLDMWSECVARLVLMTGGGESDIAQISFGYGLFTGALGLHNGLEKVGASVIPISSGNTERQLMVMQDFGTTILVCTPSYALYMSDVAAEQGINPRDLPVRIAMLGGEGHTLEMNAEIERRWGVIATENYGLSEIVGPGVSGECVHKTGQHFNEDFFLPEIIDPQTGRVLHEGEEGELVITTIDKEAFPLLRYRTKDITTLFRDTCPCGRTSLRMARVKGRSDDMLIIKGVNVYPSQVESVLLTMSGISPYYQIVLGKKGFVDTLEVHVELVDPSVLEVYSELEKVERQVAAKLHSTLGLECKVRLREPGAIERTAGKAKRVVDNRNA
ncbi:MAG: phenylacetate--CoA ligase [Clostridiales bacterium]|jgi:phenylacetate-CoA ligase|nr:phenylacetate--CoA ligase [Clostridiales bacterium]